MSGLFFKSGVNNTIDPIPSFNNLNDIVSVDSKFKKILRDVMCILTTMKDTFIYRENLGSYAPTMQFEAATQVNIDMLKNDLENELRRSLKVNLKNIDVVKSETNYLQILIVLKVEDKSDLHLVVNMNSKGAVELDSAVEKIVKYVIS